MSLQNMEVFEQNAIGSATETVKQNIDLFNEASRGAIVLASSANEGDFANQSFFKSIPGLVRRRNAYGSGAVSAVNLEQDNHTGVKVAAGTPPIAIEPQQFSWIQQSPEVAGVVYGEQLGLGIIQDQINTAIAALVAAIGGVGALVQDQTSGVITRPGLVRGAGRFGDRSNSLQCWVMHSKARDDLYLENVANASQLFELDTVSVMQDGWGRILLVTDSPALLTAGSPDTYHTLGLAQGAAMIEDNGDLFANIETSNGQENIQRTFQSELTYNVKLKGFSWDKANGGASPTSAALATAANWDQVVTSIKDTAGVLVNSQ